MTVEAYLERLPEDQRRIAEKVRALILREAPEATEYVGYGMPGYKVAGKPLIYFAAFKNHLGIYALPAAHAEFAQELASFKQGKGSVQFPWQSELPWALIARMIQFNLARRTAE
ncbi:MAG: iron chaperone [Schleiferiaceae bacterium]